MEFRRSQIFFFFFFFSFRDSSTIISSYNYSISHHVLYNKFGCVVNTVCGCWSRRERARRERKREDTRDYLPVSFFFVLFASSSFCWILTSLVAAKTFEGGATAASHRLQMAQPRSQPVDQLRAVCCHIYALTDLCSY